MSSDLPEFLWYCSLPGECVRGVARGLHTSRIPCPSDSASLRIRSAPRSTPRAGAKCKNTTSACVISDPPWRFFLWYSSGCMPRASGDATDLRNCGFKTAKNVTGGTGNVWHIPGGFADPAARPGDRGVSLSRKSVRRRCCVPEQCARCVACGAPATPPASLYALRRHARSPCPARRFHSGWSR